MTKQDLREILGIKDSNLDVKKIESTKWKGGNQLYYCFEIKSKKSKSKCPKCNKYSNKIHDYLKPVTIKHLKMSEVPTLLIVYKRRFRCKNCNKAFTEELNLNSKKGSISLDVKRKILLMLKKKEYTEKLIAEELNISKGVVRRTFDEAMINYPKQVTTLPEVISFDEKATYTDNGTYSFVLNDPINHIVLDLLPSRKKEDLLKYFSNVTNRSSVKVVICDLYEPYYQVVKAMFKNAVFIADPFHYIRYPMNALADVRIRIQNRYNRKSIEYKTLKNRKYISILQESFFENRSDLRKIKHQKEMNNKNKTNNHIYNKFEDYWYGMVKVYQNKNLVPKARIDILYSILNMFPEINKAWQLKEEFMRIVTYDNFENIEKDLKEWIKKCRESNIEEFVEVSGTIERWLEAIVYSFIDKKYNNGFTEGNNNVIEHLIQNGYGYKKFENFRKRFLYIVREGDTTGNTKEVKRRKNMKK